MKYYKVLHEDCRSCHGGSYTWIPGEWAPEIADVVLYHRGYHLCRRDDLVTWLGPAIWAAEISGDVVVEGEDKVVCGRARIVERLAWDARIARLFAADCAERVLSIYEAAYPGAACPRRAIDAARCGDAAASYAAGSASYAAAAYAAYPATAAAYAAYPATNAAAKAAERAWQTDRLFYYLDG